MPIDGLFDGVSAGHVTRLRFGDFEVPELPDDCDGELLLFNKTIYRKNFRNIVQGTGALWLLEWLCRRQPTMPVELTNEMRWIRCDMAVRFMLMMNPPGDFCPDRCLEYEEFAGFCWRPKPKTEPEETSL